MSASVRVGNEELFTVRDAMRGLNLIVDDIVEGKLDKAVLTRHGKMLCAVVPLGNIALELAGHRSTEG